MQYDQYQGKVKKVAAFLAKVYAVRVFLIIALATLAVLATATVAVKGLVITQSPCPAEVPYGEAPVYDAAAVLGTVSFEYRKQGNTAWSTEIPDFVGAYQVRAVSVSAFGTPRYGEVQDFQVVPREISPVATAGQEVIYGEVPQVTVATLGGDLLSCGVVYESIEVPSAAVRVDASTVRVTDAEGRDRTACYKVADTPASSITLIPRPLEITVQDADKVYDGVALSFDGYEISNGTLVEEDTLLAVFDDSLTIAGTLINSPEMRVLSPDGTDVTGLYRLIIRPGTLTVEQRPLIVETGTSSHPYNGHEQSNHQFSVDASTSLVEGHTLVVRNAATLLDCGSVENLLELDVYDAEQNLQTENYSIFLRAGTLTVVPREITVSTESMTFVYDGKPHSHTGATADLPEGEILDTSLIHNTVITDVGSVPNSVQVQIFRGGKNITDNYIIRYEFGTLTVEPRPIVVKIANASKTYDGTPLTSATYAVVVAPYNSTEFPALDNMEMPPLSPIDYYPETMLRDGSLDGEVDPALIPGTYYYFVEGQVLTLETQGSVLFGTGESRYVEGSVRVYRRPDKQNSIISGPLNKMPGAVDVTDNYIVTVLPGTLTVNPRPVTVTALSAQKAYDGTALTQSAFEVTVPEQVPGETIPSEGLLEGHRMDALTIGSQTDVGISPNAIDLTRTRILDTQNGDADVTAYYTITPVEGTLEVIPCQIKVATATREWIYDGQVHADDTVTLLAVLNEGKFVEGHTLVCLTAPPPSLIDVGSISNKLEVGVLDGDTWVTHNYAITCEFGMLTVKPRPITVKTASCEKMYDGTPLRDTAAAPELVKGQLVEGFRLGYTILPGESRPEITNVGSTENNRRVVVLSRDGLVDATHNYAITCEYGTLTVTPRPVTLKIPDKTWIYSGMAEEVTAGYTVDPSSAYGLVDGHWTIAAQMDPPPTYLNVGTYVNERPAAIFDEASGEEVTANYQLTYVKGTITILPRPLVVGLFGEKYYDDTPLAGDEIRAVYWGEYALCEGHTLTVAPLATITDVGTLTSYPNKGTLKICKDAEDVSRNYTVTYAEGFFEIYPRPLGVQSYDAAKLYDGTPLTEPDGFASEQGMALVDGHSLSVNATGTAVAVGTYPNTVSPDRVHVTNAQGVDKTYNYTIVAADPGTLTILDSPVRVSVQTGSDQKLYDGVPLECPTYTARGEADLPKGYKLTVYGYNSLTDPGRELNSAVVEVRDQRGNPVAAPWLELKAEYGTLTVMMPGGGSSGGSSFRTTVGWIQPEQDGVFYLRENSFGDFNRRTWYEADNQYGQALPGGYGYQYLTSHGLEMLGSPLSRAHFKEMICYLLPYYPQIDGGAPAVGSDTVNWDVQAPAYSTFLFYTESGLDLVARYMALTADQRASLLGEYADEELAYREHVYAEYLYVHPETRAFLQTIIDEQGFDPRDPEVIAKVARYIQGAATYNADSELAFMIEQSEDAVIAFLRDYKEGLCRHYASAAAMVYRLLGIPARYTVGFMLEAKAGQWNEIISSDGDDNQAHAWVEVYLDGMGWVAVEVTGGSEGGGSGSGSGSGGECDGSCGGTCEDCASGEMKPALVITPVFCTKPYDGTPLHATHDVELTYELEELLDMGYTYSVTVDGFLTEVGESDSRIVSFTLYDFLGTDVTSMFNVIKKPGLLKVTRSPVEVFLYPLDKTYDGKPAQWGAEDYEVMKLNPGHTLQLAIHIPLAEAGYVNLSELNRKADSMATFAVFNESGEDVTGQFTLVFVQPEGMDDIPVLQIRRRPISLTAASETGVYETGMKPLANPAVHLSLGTLVEGHTLTATAVGKQSEIGSSRNVVEPGSVVILDRNGTDVTKNYRPDFIDGTLTLIEEPK